MHSAVKHALLEEVFIQAHTHKSALEAELTRHPGEGGSSREAATRSRAAYVISELVEPSYAEGKEEVPAP